MRRPALAAAAALQMAAFIRSYRRYKELPSQGRATNEHGHAEEPPAIGVVVPCRNEAGRVPSLLKSLKELRYPNFKVLVVDDNSSDATAAVATAAGFECLRLSSFPPGWTGKNWACWNGANQLEAEWLLFVDADVCLEAEALQAAMSRARSLGASLYSIFLTQICESFWEKVLLPYVYAMYFVSGGGRYVNSCPEMALANGQFLLARRTDYFAVGGHAASRSSVIDDIALARQFIRSEKRVAIARGDALGSVRMYRGLSDIRKGFGKNAADFTGGVRTGWGTICASVLCFSLAWTALRSRSPVLIALLAVNALGVTPWYRQFGVRRGYALLHPVAAIVFQAIAIEASGRRLLKRQTWAGRTLP